MQGTSCTIGLDAYCRPDKIARQTVVIFTKSNLIHNANDEELMNGMTSQETGLTIQDHEIERKMAQTKRVRL